MEQNVLKVIIYSIKNCSIGLILYQKLTRQFFHGVTGKCYILLGFNQHRATYCLKRCYPKVALPTTQQIETSKFGLKLSTLSLPGNQKPQISINSQTRQSTYSTLISWLSILTISFYVQQMIKRKKSICRFPQTHDKPPSLL